VAAAGTPVLERVTRAVPVVRAELAVGALLAALLVPIALLRVVDGDEGSYLLASRLVAHGTVPYTDFIYPQMPLLPYVYGAWSLLFGESWYAVRVLSALLAVGLGVLLYRHSRGRFGAGPAAVGLVLFASSSLVFGWFTVVKTYAFSTLLLFAAYALVERRGEPAGRWAWVGAGAALALALDTRLIFAAAVPPFLWAALRERSGRWFERLAPVAGGLALGLLPALVFFANDPRRFFFDNLQAQGTRSSGGLVGDLPQKAQVAANLLGFGQTEGVVGPQFLLLLLAAAAGIAAVWVARRRVSLAVLLVAFLGGASFLPTPTYPQYFCIVIPFGIVAALEVVEGVRARIDRDLGLVLRVLVGAGLAAYVSLAAIDVVRYARTHRAFDARIATVERVTSIVDANTRPGEEVLASWPGYLFGSHAKPVPGLENDFSPRNASTISAAKAHRYRMATIADVEGWIAERRTRLVVVRLWSTLPPLPDWEGALARGGYRQLARVGSARIYLRGPA
jgi:4-amino-4-deoxy-L-arabinose transferase-like glycosyltransferase